MAHEEVNPAQVGFSEPVRAIEWIPGHNRSPFANDSGVWFLERINEFATY